MASDLLIHLEDRPGTVAQVGEILGNAGINVDGVCGFAQGGTGYLHVLVADGGMAKTALTDAGLQVQEEREVELVAIVDVPGEMGRHLRHIADAGVNLDLVYLATNTRLVLGADDLEGLRKAIHGG